jgi:hypothetical protein
MMDDTTGLALPASPEDAGVSQRFWEHILGGIVVATVSFAVVLYAAYHGFVVSDLAADWAYAGIGCGFVFFALGAFVFSFGWTGGDMPRTIRLTTFICVVMLAIVVAVIILLKSKGSAAKAAGNVGGAAARSKGYDPIPVVQAVGSMFIDEESEQEEDASAGPEMLFQIKCGGCGATFAPVPPAARCPFCNEAALAV